MAYGWCSECLAKAFPGDFEFFREDSGFGDGGHEVGVAVPAGKDVHVDVAGDSGSGAFSYVHAYIEAGGLVDFPQVAFGLACEFHELGRGGFVYGREVGGVLIGDHHEVAAGVGEFVEDYEVILRAMDDQV